MGKKEKKRKLKKVLKIVLIIFLILHPVIICLGNPWTRLENGSSISLEIELNNTEVKAGSNTILKAEVTLKNRGPILYFIEDPDHFNSKEIFIELPDGNIVEYWLMCMCSPELVFWGPFRSESWKMSVGGIHFDTQDHRFMGMDREGPGFTFNETGEYKVWAEYNSNGYDEGNDHLPPPADHFWRSNKVTVKVV